MTMCVRAIALTVLTASLVAGLTETVRAQRAYGPYGDVFQALGYPGDFRDGVLRMDLSRHGVGVTFAGITPATPFPVDGWVAITKADNGAEIVTGELVLLDDEVNPVVSALIENGFEVTGLHNHFVREQPRLFYVHLRGRGPAAQLANNLKPVLDLVAKRPMRVSTRPDRGAASTRHRPRPIAGTRMNTRRLDEILGYKGNQLGATYQLTIGRAGVDVHEMGATMNSQMGLNTTAVFAGTHTHAAIVGHVAALANEVGAVLKALRSSGIEVVSIDQLSSDTPPTVVFLYYSGTGPAERLASGLRSVLDLLGKSVPARP